MERLFTATQVKRGQNVVDLLAYDARPRTISARMAA
jgi:hypothetical protein